MFCFLFQNFHSYSFTLPSTFENKNCMDGKTMVIVAVNNRELFYEQQYTVKSYRLGPLTNQQKVKGQI